MQGCSLALALRPNFLALGLSGLELVALALNALALA